MKRSHLDRMNQESDRPVEVIGYLSNTTSTKVAELYVPTLEVLDLLAFLPEDIAEKARALTSWKRLYHNGSSINQLDRIGLVGIVDGVFTKFKLPEQVAEFNGIAIPAMLECKVQTGLLKHCNIIIIFVLFLVKRRVQHLQ